MSISLARDHADVVIVGAGAAGLAAAAALCGHPLDVVVLEARGRIGGRAWTMHPRNDLPLDAGCGWLHSADENVLAKLFESRGIPIDRTPPHWTRQSANQGFSPDDQHAFHQAYEAFEGRMAARAQTGVDAPGSDFFDPACRWNPLIDAVSAYYNGAEYDQVSVLDYAAYQDTEVHWRVLNGYGAAIGALGRDRAQAPELVLDCPVTVIDHSATPIRLKTAKRGLSARAVIITVPTPLLAEERIVFTPTLAQKVETAAALPFGLADKAFLYLGDSNAVPVEGHMFGRIDRTETASDHLRPFGRLYVEIYLGGRHAWDLEREGPGAMIAFALEELRDLIGSNFVAALSPIAETGWASDPWALGAYSHALPGHAGARADLAAPIDGRLFFAGEATHPKFYSTAHGAWESGARGRGGGGGSQALSETLGGLARDAPERRLSAPKRRRRAKGRKRPPILSAPTGACARAAEARLPPSRPPIAGSDRNLAGCLE